MQIVDGKPVYSKAENIAGAIGFLVLGVMMYLLFSEIFGEKQDSPDKSAFNTCHEQLKLIAHPAYASVSRVNGRLDGAQYYFAWPSSEGMTFGGRTVSASCFVNRQTLEITSLTVNGTEHIWRRPESP